MPRKNLDVDELATIADGIGHPVRAAILYALREKSPQMLPDLRRDVSARYIETDSRNLQFHLFKMQLAGLVSVQKDGNRQTASLIKDVTVTPREVR